MKGPISILFFFVVSAVYAQIPTGLVAHYPFNGNVSDSTGLGGDGVLVGGSLTYACGVSGEAAYFDGSGVYVDLLGSINNLLNDTTDHTVSLFINNVHENVHQAVLDKRAGCSRYSQGWNIRINFQGTKYSPEFITNTVSRGRAIPFFTSDCWTHFVVTKQGPFVTMYKNGSPVDSVVLPSGYDYSNTANLRIGYSACIGHDGTQPLESPIDELMFFNRAITASEVSDIYRLFLPQNTFNVINENICEGDSVLVSLNSVTCQQSILWTPTIGVSDPTSLTTYLSPFTTTSYQVIQMSNSVCVDTQFVNITVDSCTTICDTLVLNDTLYLNTIVTIDTFFITELDTVFLRDTSVIPINAVDTFWVVDTVLMDTLVQTTYDTLVLRDTTVLPITIRDTIYRVDTLVMDTLFQFVNDTLVLTDTVCADTLYVDLVDPSLPVDTVVATDTIVLYDTIVTLDSVIFVPYDVYMHIPPSFTPNGDGITDVWGITGVGFTVLELKILDGSLLVFQSPPGTDWDGTLNGNALPSGTYTFEAKLRVDRNHVIFYRTGTLTLVR